MKRLLISVYQICHTGLSALGLRGIWPLPQINRLLKWLLRSRSVTVHGKCLYLDRRDSMNLSINPDYEPLETELMRKLIRPGDMVVDIGAHIGYYTLLFSDLAGEQGRISAFEPDPDNYRMLAKNVGINSCSNVAVVNKAVAELSGTSRIYFSDRNTGDHQTYDAGANRRSAEIEVVSLDDYFADDVCVDFIKMDIQGAEYRALKGMHRLLARSGAVRLITEFSPTALRASGVEPQAMVVLLQELGFMIQHVNEDTGQVEPFDMSRVLNRCTRPGSLFTNLLCVREP